MLAIGTECANRMTASRRSFSESHLSTRREVISSAQSSTYENGLVDVPIPLPTVAGEVKLDWNLIHLAVAIDVVDAQPAELVVYRDRPLVVWRSLHEQEIRSGHI